MNTFEFGNNNTNENHQIEEFNWMVTKDEKGLIKVSIIAEGPEGYVTLNISEELWENLKEDVDEMIYEIYFGDKDG
jgi:hypothetical protein